MVDKISADASPEKRLFISLLTRDITLIAAFLDLIDNSVNAAIEPYADRMKNANQYLELASDPLIKPNIKISINFSKSQVEIVDTAGGISAAVAAKSVFRFGKDPKEKSTDDRLSVYGIGLKRAMFKLGNKVEIRSDHVEGGFDLNLNVSKWASDRTTPWSFPITEREPSLPADCGTRIIVSDLYEEVQTRLADGLFEAQLRESIAKTYAFFMAKIVVLDVNRSEVAPVSIEIGENYASRKFNFGKASCAITAGIGVSEGGGFRDRSAGWFVFCNGRAVVSADKSTLTGWGSGLPIFQPKHRPFLGTVFFVSPDPEELPWMTTKAGINEDSGLWQIAKREMAATGREIISFLDGRYTDEGTEVPSRDLQVAAGIGRSSVVAASVSAAKVFKAPPPEKNRNIKIQYDAKTDDVKAVATYLGRSGMSGSDVGRHTFQHFLRNEVGEK